ncbi:ice-binding family protein [Cryobacterium sp. Y11]|uniref:ice-binding family protein n=1 Tax=Cryobacterium sp. Y11 TaxID=2045016 RepID=UPI000CE466E2|nr:ice-binding family protein [Cryobacterium sp. Y11]
MTGVTVSTRLRARALTLTLTLTLALALVAGTALPAQAWSSPAPVALGVAESFSVLGASTATNTGLTTTSGDVGVSPGTAVTGMPPENVAGSIKVGADAAEAHADLQLAYADAAGRESNAILAPEIVGTTLIPGVYRAVSSVGITGTLTLDAGNDRNAVFIMQIGSTLTTASGSAVSLINGAQASNVFWQVGSSATLGAMTIFAGTILAQASITVTTGTAFDGRALALDGAVTLDSNTFTLTPVRHGTLTASTGGAPLSEVVLNGTSTQYATGSGTQWSVIDDRGTGAAWTLTVTATAATSAAGTVELVARSLPVGSLVIDPGPITLGPNGVNPELIVGPALTMSGAPQTLLSSVGSNTGTYLLTPTFSLAIPSNAFRPNYAGDINASPLNPYVSTLTFTIS